MFVFVLLQDIFIFPGWFERESITFLFLLGDLKKLEFSVEVLLPYLRFKPARVLMSFSGILITDPSGTSPRASVLVSFRCFDGAPSFNRGEAMDGGPLQARPWKRQAPLFGRRFNRHASS